MAQKTDGVDGQETGASVTEVSPELEYSIDLQKAQAKRWESYSRNLSAFYNEVATIMSGLRSHDQATWAELSRAPGERRAELLRQLSSSQGRAYQSQREAMNKLTEAESQSHLDLLGEQRQAYEKYLQRTNPGLVHPTFFLGAAEGAASFPEGSYPGWGGMSVFDPRGYYWR